MKKTNLAFIVSFLFLSASCTRSNSNSEASSKAFKNCDFKVLAFASYNDDSGKMVYDYEDLEMWTQEGTHDYAIKNNDAVQSASVEVLKNGKLLKSVDFKLEKAGTKLTHLNDASVVTQSIRSIGGMSKGSSLRFVFKLKNKKTCKQDIGVFVE